MSTKSGLTAWERWELASFDAADDAVPPAPTGDAGTMALPTASQSAKEAERPPPPAEDPALVALREQIQREAQAEGYAAGQREGEQAGYAEGMRRAEDEIAQRGEALAATLGGIIERLDQQIASLDQSVADEVLALSLAVARRIVQQVHHLRPETVVDTVRRALGQLSVQHAAIHLHPEDASLLRLYAGEQIAHLGHRIHENPTLARGDVILEAGGSQLDASLETRWRRIVESLGAESDWFAVGDESLREPELPFDTPAKS